MNLPYLIQYIHYRLTAKHRRGYGLHSPFLYGWVRTISDKKYTYYALEQIPELKKEYWQTERKGTSGKKKFLFKPHRYNNFGREKYGEIVFKTILQLQPAALCLYSDSFNPDILYPAMANRKIPVYLLLSGNISLTDRESDFIRKRVGNIRTLSQTLENTNEMYRKASKIPQMIGMNLRNNPEKKLKLFEQYMENSHDETVFYLEEIRHTDQAYTVWKTMQKHPRVRLTADFFGLAFLFLNPSLSKQDFIINC